MQQRIQAMVVKSGKTQLIDLFGYTTKGIPGLEIIGLGSQGRILKEKLFFLARSLNCSLPKRRFVLCIDLPDGLQRNASGLEFQWLELPLFILYMTLGGIFPLYSLENCFSAGCVDLACQFDDWVYHHDFFERHEGELKSCLIVSQDQEVPSSYQLIDISPLMSSAVVASD